LSNALTTILAAALFTLTGCAATAASSGSHSYDPNTMNVLVGASLSRYGSGVGLGANYERRREDKLGLGGFADIAFAKDTSTVVGGAIFWHPEDRVTVFGGPGVNFGAGNTDVLARLGGYYTFEVKKYTIAPTAWVDLSRDVAFFIGVGFVFNF
jgi:hypothetical protein